MFEYYISHHLGKSFESVFGGVTCLPGCFCMYRIKGRKQNWIVPILASPDIVEEYSENVVDTLHKKVTIDKFAAFNLLFRIYCYWEKIDF